MRRAVLLVVAACRANAAAPPSVPPPHVPAAAPAPTTAIVFPGIDKAYVAELGDDVDRVVAGGIRAEVAHDRAVLADDRFALPIVGFTRVKTGWLFLTGDGQLFRAASFLGSPGPLGAVPPDHWRRPAHEEWYWTAPRSCERIAIVTRDPAASLWLSDGTASPALARGLPPGQVIAAAFADAGEGMAAIDGGELYATHDGGVSWHRVDLGDDAAADINCVDGKLHVTTSSGPLVFDRGGRAKPAPPPVSSRPRPDFARLIADAVLARSPALAGDKLGGEDSQHCIERPWGYATARACRYQVLRIDPVTHAEKRVSPPPPRPEPRRHHQPDAERFDLAQTAFAADGVHAAWGCRADLRGDAGALCLLRADGKVTHVPLGHEEMLGSDRDVYVMMRDRHELVQLDMESGAERAAYKIELPAGAGWRRRAARLVDGVVVGVAHGGTTSWLVRVDVARNITTSRELPHHLTRAGFIDRRRGVAVGDDLAKLWETADGGATWTSLATTVDGAIPAHDADVTCTDKRCVIDHRVVVTFDDASPFRDHVVGSEPALPAPPAPRAPVAPDPRSFACTERGVRQVPATDDSDDPDAAGRVHYRRESVELDLATRPRWDLAWRGHDWRGAYSGITATGAAIEPGSSWRLITASRDGLLLDYLRWVWVPAGGAPVLLPEAAHPEIPDIKDAVVLPDGRLAVLFRFGQFDKFDRLLVYDRGGRIVARRTLYWTDDLSFDRGIAIVHGVVGVESMRDARWFYPITATPREKLAPFDAGKHAICRGGTPRASDLTLRVIDDGSIWHVYLRGDCVQAIDRADRRNHTEMHDVLASATADGELATEVLDTERAFELRCRVAPP